MLGPAPVSLDPAGDGGAWRWAVAGLHGAAAAVLLAWRVDLWTLLAAVGLMTAGAAALRVRAGARLAWDGQAWALDGRPVSAAIALDLDGWMLLQLREEAGRRHWLPLSPARAGAAWPALRAALYGTPLQAG
jgi:hypothetical protein